MRTVKVARQHRPFAVAVSNDTRRAFRRRTLSQQLTVLREERLVNTRREGKQIFYSIASQEALAVMQVLYQLYCPKDQEK